MKESESPKIDMRKCLAEVGCTGLVFHRCQDGHEMVFTPNGGNCPHCRASLKSMNYYMRHHMRLWRARMNRHIDDLASITAGLALYAWFVIHFAVIVSALGG